jgi:hypothetical protein
MWHRVDRWSVLSVSEDIAAFNFRVVRYVEEVRSEVYLTTNGPVSNLKERVAVLLLPRDQPRLKKL